MIPRPAAHVQKPLPAPGLSQIENQAFFPAVDITSGGRITPVVIGSGNLFRKDQTPQPPIADMFFPHSRM